MNHITTYTGTSYTLFSQETSSVSEEQEAKLGWFKRLLTAIWNCFCAVIDWLCSFFKWLFDESSAQDEAPSFTPPPVQETPKKREHKKRQKRVHFAPEVIILNDQPYYYEIRRKELLREEEITKLIEQAKAIFRGVKKTSDDLAIVDNPFSQKPWRRHSI